MADAKIDFFSAFVNEHEQNQRELMITINVLCVIVSGPSVSLYVDFNEKDHQALDLLPVVILLGHSNSAVNPLLYWLMTRRLHRARSTVRRRRLSAAGAADAVAKPTAVTADRRPADCVTLQLLGDVTAAGGHSPSLNDADQSVETPN